MNQSPEKKVIFVGGTSYSGSTLLDMLLANSPGGFSCGEVYAMFHPFRKHHMDPVCGCGDPQCGIWGELKQQGPGRLYQSIFEMFPEVDCIVDSSKDPMWIRDRSADLAKTDIGVSNVLIWKTPQEFHQSRLKRHQEHRWESEWINYHRHYFSLIDEWVSLPYAELVKSPDTLRRLCNYLQIPWFEGKTAYWEKRHHTLFGNTSAKIHLYDRKSDQFQKCREELSEQEPADNREERKPGAPYQEIYYQAPGDGVRESRTDYPLVMSDIERVLSGSSLYSNPDQKQQAKLQATELEAGYLYRIYRRVRRRAVTVQALVTSS